MKHTQRNSTVAANEHLLKYKIQQVGAPKRAPGCAAAEETDIPTTKQTPQSTRRATLPLISDWITQSEGTTIECYTMYVYLPRSLFSATNIDTGSVYLLLTKEIDSFFIVRIDAKSWLEKIDST